MRVKFTATGFVESKDPLDAKDMLNDMLLDREKQYTYERINPEKPWVENLKIVTEEVIN